GLVRAAAQRSGKEVAILQDLSGPKIRVGDVASRRGADGREIEAGEELTLVTQGEGDGVKRIAVSYARLALEVQTGERILLADATLELVVEDVAGDAVVCRGI